MPRPGAVEADEFGAVATEDLRAYIALGEDVTPSSNRVYGFITSADDLPFPEAPTS